MDAKLQAPHKDLLQMAALWAQHDAHAAEKRGALHQGFSHQTKVRLIKETSSGKETCRIAECF